MTPSHLQVSIWPTMHQPTTDLNSKTLTFTCNMKNDIIIDLVTVFDAILTSRQAREKLQCLYENLMSNNFRRMAVLKKI